MAGRRVHRRHYIHGLRCALRSFSHGAPAWTGSPPPPPSRHGRVACNCVCISWIEALPRVKFVIPKALSLHSSYIRTYSRFCRAKWKTPPLRWRLAFLLCFYCSESGGVIWQILPIRFCRNSLSGRWAGVLNGSRPSLLDGKVKPAAQRRAGHAGKKVENFVRIHTLPPQFAPKMP